MTLADFISVASLASLVYFCVGTYRIERTLTKVEQHLERIRSIASDISDEQISRHNLPKHGRSSHSD